MIALSQILKGKTGSSQIETLKIIETNEIKY